MKPFTEHDTIRIAQLRERLGKSVKWSKTADPIHLWRATVGLETWVVRVNDFPDEHLYSLLVNNREAGSFDEWPSQWQRVEDSGNAS
jgi:hypothetical protein